MDRSRHLRRHRSSSKSKKSSKKKRSRDENGSGSDNKIVSVSSSVVKPLVEYSDVSSEDLSEPEAGEIQSEESPPFHDGIGHRKPSADDDRDSYRHSSRKSLSLSHRIVDSSLLSHSPSPRNERKHSVSSDVSRSSSMRRKRHDSSPHAFSMRQVISSPSVDLEEYEYRKHRKKKEKKHKKEKKSSKKKKKKSKHRSRSSSVENVSSVSPKSKQGERNIDQLSDWETYQPVIDQVAHSCSPISPPSVHSSTGHDRIDNYSPRSGTPPQPPPKKFSTDSPHTPILPAKAYEVTKIDIDDHCSNYSGRKQFSGSPILSDHHSISPVRIEEYQQPWARHSLSPVKSSPFRNPSPDVQIIDMSPSRKRKRIEKEISHRRYRKVHYGFKFSGSFFFNLLVISG